MDTYSAWQIYYKTNCFFAFACLESSLVDGVHQLQHSLAKLIDFIPGWVTSMWELTTEELVQFDGKPTLAVAEARRKVLLGNLGSAIRTICNHAQPAGYPQQPMDVFEMLCAHVAQVDCGRICRHVHCGVHVGAACGLQRVPLKQAEAGVGAQQGTGVRQQRVLAGLVRHLKLSHARVLACLGVRVNDMRTRGKLCELRYPFCTILLACGPS